MTTEILHPLSKFKIDNMTRVLNTQFVLCKTNSKNQIYSTLYW